MGGPFGGPVGPGAHPRLGRALHLGDRSVRIPGWVKRAGRAVSIDALRRAAGAALGGSRDAAEDTARLDHLRAHGLTLICDYRDMERQWFVVHEDAPATTWPTFSDPRAAIDAHRAKVRQVTDDYLARVRHG